MENVAVILGNNLFIGTPVLRVEINNKLVEFLKVREIFRERSEGSYLTIDCDIKDKDNKREIKLEKSRPVARPDTVDVIFDHTLTHVTREDGSTIIKIEQIPSTNRAIAKEERIASLLKEKNMNSVIRITGHFYAGGNEVLITNDMMRANGVTWSGCRSWASGGLRLYSNRCEW
jgi:hypothetical protein